MHTALNKMLVFLTLSQTMNLLELNKIDFIQNLFVDRKIIFQKSFSFLVKH